MVLSTTTIAAAAAVTASDHSEPEDAALVSRVKGGDRDAFGLLVKRYRRRLYAVIYNLTGNSEDAADLTQDAFIKAFQSIGRFREQAGFYTWLYRIGVNGAISYLKRHKRARFFSLDSIDESQAASLEVVERLTARQKADRPTLIRELGEKLNEALQKLSLKHRTAIVLFEMEGLSHAEIARITDTSEGTVRSRVHYAKQFLQAELKPYLEQ